MKNNLAVNTLIYAIGDIAPKFFGLVTFPILTSYLSTEDYGILNYVNSINSLLSILTFLGLNTFYMAHYYKVGNEFEKRKLIGNLTIAVLFINIVFTVFMYLCGAYIFRIIGSKVDYSYIFLGVLINFFGTFSTLPSALYRLKENPLPLTVVNIMRGFLIMIATLIFVRMYHSATAALAIQLVVSIVFAAFFGWVTVKNAVFIFNWNQIRVALVFSLPLVPGYIAYYFSNMSDRILIEKYLSVSDLGFYSSATVVAGMLSLITHSALRAFEPYFFKQYGKDSFIKEFRYVRDILMFVVIISGMALCVYSVDFLRLLSAPAYHGAYIYVPLLVSSIIVGSLSSMYATIMTAQSKTKISGSITIAAAFVSVLANAIFLPYIGVWSAAITALIVKLISYFSLKQFTKMPAGPEKFVLIVGMMLAVCYMVLYHNNSDSQIANFCYRSGIFVLFTIIVMKVLNVNRDLVKLIYRNIVR